MAKGKKHGRRVDRPSVTQDNTALLQKQKRRRPQKFSRTQKQKLRTLWWMRHEQLKLWAREARKVPCSPRHGSGVTQRWETPLPTIDWEWIAWSADCGIYRSVGTIKAWWSRERKKVYKLFPEMERMDVIMQRVRDAENADGEYED